MEDFSQSEEGLEQMEALPIIESVASLQRYFLLFALGLSSLLFGSKMRPDDFTKRVEKPMGMWLTIIVSVILSPLTAYLLSLVMKLHFSAGIMLLVTACCPAGSLSPIFAYYTQADVCLCMSVMVLSTLMSVGMIPLGVYLSSNAYRDLELAVIPNSVIVVTLSVLIGCIAVGMILRNHREKWADKLVRTCSFTPILVMVLIIIVVGVKIPHSLHATPIEVFAVLLYLIIHLAGTYLLGWLAGQDHEICRAMAFCAASKSVLLAVTIVHSSFEGEVLISTLAIPTLFLIQYILIGLLLSAIYQIYRFYAPSVNV